MATIGKYEVVEQIGEGAMGVVYKATDPVLNRTVAIKVMSEGLAQDEVLRERFLREAQAAGSLQHPNLVTIYDFGQTDGHLFIAMEYIEGVDLEKLMAKGTQLALPVKLDMIIDVLNGLSFAHRRGIVHRDIKPANIRIDQEGRGRIMDFGVAKMSTSNLTGTGVMMGTPNYMAPEQITGEKTLGPAADIWAVGAVLYELITGTRPFEADTLHRVLFKIVSDNPTLMTETVPGLPVALDDIMRRALAKDPDHRYKTAAEMANALTAVRAKLGGARMSKTIAARVSIADPTRVSSDVHPTVGALPPAPASRMSPMLIGGGVVGLLIAVGLVAYLASVAGRAPAPAVEPPPAAARVASADSAARAATPAPQLAAQPTPPPPVTQSPPAQPPATRDVATRSAGAPPASTTPRRQTDTERVATSTPPQSQTTSTAAQGAPVNSQAATQTQTQTQAAPPPPVVSAPAPAPTQVVSQPPANVQSSPPTTPPPAAPENPRPAIEALLADYARAIGTRQVAEVRRVYAGMTPQQQAGWEGFFSSTRSITPTLEISSLNVGTGSATARVTGAYEFVTRAGRTERQPASFEATFAKQGETWVLQRIR